MGSCRVMSAEVNGPAVNPRWDGMSIGMHWDALCRGINSSCTRQHWTKDVRVDHPATSSLTARTRLVVLRPCPSQKWPCHLQPGERKPRNTRPILCLLPSATHPEATRRQDTPCPTPAAHDDLFVSSPSIAGPQLKHIQPVLRGQQKGTPLPRRWQAPRHQSGHAGLNLLPHPLPTCVFPKSRNPAGRFSRRKH